MIGDSSATQLVAQGNTAEPLRTHFTRMSSYATQTGADHRAGDHDHALGRRRAAMKPAGHCYRERRGGPSFHAWLEAQQGVLRKGACDSLIQGGKCGGMAAARLTR